MSKKNRKGLSSFSIGFTSTVSVTLLLILLTIIAVLGVVAHKVSTSVRGNVGFDVVLADSISREESTALFRELSAAPYVSSAQFVSREEAAKQWADDTGEDLVAMLGVNPLCDEIAVKVKADWASNDSIDVVTAPLRSDARVAEISTHADVVKALNDNIRIISIILLAVAAALVFISFMLINNTIRLNIHSRRFLIHTMKLVGAKSGFIRRPFIISNALSGLIAGIIACFVVGYGFYNLTIFEPSLSKIVTLEWQGIISGVIILVGIIICAVSAYFATSKYVRLGYDKMFK